MNLIKTNFMELREAFDKLEGIGFFEEGFRTLSPYKLLKAMTWVLDRYKEAEEYANENWQNSNKDWSELRHEHLSEPYAFVCIYGTGGGHRYFVNRKGDIRFSSNHAAKEQIALAEKLGFEVT